MKKLIIAATILTGLMSNAQKTIYETALNSEKPVVKYKYLPIANKLLIYEACDKKTAYAIFNNAYSFDVDGKKDNIIENEKFLYLNPSVKNDAFTAIYAQGMSKAVETEYVDGKKYNMPDKDFNAYKRYTDFFNKTTKVIITDDSDKWYIKIQKKPINIQKYDFIKQSKKTVVLQNPDLQRLQTNDIKAPRVISFRSIFNKNDNVEIITKSVAKTYNNSTLYRTIYDLDGKKVNDYSYKVKLSKGYFSYALNFSTEENMANGPSNDHMVPTEDLDINEFYIDNKNDDVYIYGVAMNEKKDPIGFYLNKYSKDGTVIWEKFYDVDDKKGFNNYNKYWMSSSIYLREYMNENTVVVSLHGENDSMNNNYNHFFVIDKSSGNIIKQASLESDSKSAKGTFTYDGKYSIFENTKINKNRYCSKSTLLAMALNDKVKKQINQVNSKQDVFFDTLLTSEGIWLLESDNDTYFKTTLFQE